MYTVEGMGVGAESDVGLAFPILQVVDRFGSGEREIGDFVAMDSVGLEEVYRGLIKVCDAIFRGHVRRTIPLAAQQNFRDAVTSFERTVVAGALGRNSQNWASAARELGMDRANLNRLAKRLGLK